MSAHHHLPETSATVKAGSTSRIYAVVLSVGVLCSLAIVTTYEVTRPVIAGNRIAQLRRAILDVIPDADSIAAFKFDEKAGKFSQVPEATGDAELVYAGFDTSGEVMGIAIAAQGTGYQDAIRLLYGYVPQTQSVVGIRVLESRETPGLGDRIETDDHFLNNFALLDVRMRGDGERLEHEIEFVKPGAKTEAWQIDGISGATISSRAVAEMIRGSTNLWVPRIHRNQSQIRATTNGEPSA